MDEIATGLKGRGRCDPGNRWHSTGWHALFLHGKRWPIRLESDSDLGFYDQERLMTEAGLPIPYSSACRYGEECLSAVTRPRANVRLPRNGVRGYIEGVLIGAAGLPPATREQQITAGGVEIGKVIATVGTVAYAGAKARAQGGGQAGIPVDEFETFAVYGPDSGRMSTTGVEVMVRMFNDGASACGYARVRGSDPKRYVDTYPKD